MKLLYTLTTYPPTIGGAQLHHHLLAQQLKTQHQIQVLTHWRRNRTDWLLGTTLRAPEKGSSDRLDGIPVEQLTLSKTEKWALLPYVCLYYPWMRGALPKIAHCIQGKIQPYGDHADLIHNVRIGREGISFASYYAAKKADIPFVFTPVHHPRWVGWRYEQYIKLYRLADHLFALTEAEKQTLIELGVSPQKITVTGIGPILSPEPQPDLFRTKYKVSEPMILFLGQHYPYKGYQQILEAAPLVWQKYPDAQFVFVGPPVKNSEDYFTKSDRRIHRLGAVDLQTKTNALAACDLLCVPSTQESFGGVYTEAWALKKPVIGCSIPAVKMVVSHQEDGLLVEQNLTEIAHAIIDLLSDNQRRKRMGEKGFKKVESRYNWPVISRKVERVYNSLVS